jgi:hypothetical protein
MAALVVIMVVCDRKRVKKDRPLDPGWTPGACRSMCHFGQESWCVQGKRPV